MENMFSPKSIRKMVAGVCWSYIAGTLARKIFEKKNILIKDSLIYRPAISIAFYMYFLKNMPDNCNITQLPKAQLIDLVIRASGVLGEQNSNMMKPLPEIIIGCIGILVFLYQYHQGDSPLDFAAMAKECASVLKSGIRKGSSRRGSRLPAGEDEGLVLFPLPGRSEPQASVPPVLPPRLISKRRISYLQRQRSE